MTGNRTHSDICLPCGWRLDSEKGNVVTETGNTFKILREISEPDADGYRAVKCMVPGCIYLRKLKEGSLSKLRRDAEKFHQNVSTKATTEATETKKIVLDSIQHVDRESQKRLREAHELIDNFEKKQKLLEKSFDKLNRGFSNNLYIDQWVNLDISTMKPICTPIYKIGKGWSGREEKVSAQNPFSFPVVAVFRDMSQYESAIHHKLTDVRLEGDNGREWFDFSSLVDDPYDHTQVKMFVWNLLSEQVMFSNPSGQSSLGTL